MRKCAKCKVEKQLSDFHHRYDEVKSYQSWCKSCVYASQIKRWTDRKIKAVNLLGGKCKLCGYKRNYASLDFHHLDPQDKEFDWSKLRLKKWDLILKELSKCILLCRNCHGELHNPQAFIDDQYELRLNDNNNLNLDLKPTGKCLYCECDVYGSKFCSTNCSTLSRRKSIRPKTKEELEKLIQENGYVKTGKLFGVSDNAIRKWLNQY